MHFGALRPLIRNDYAQTGCIHQAVNHTPFTSFGLYTEGNPHSVMHRLDTPQVARDRCQNKLARRNPKHLSSLLCHVYFPSRLDKVALQEGETTFIFYGVAIFHEGAILLYQHCQTINILIVYYNLIY